jgi:hypothetical protein
MERPDISEPLSPGKNYRLVGRTGDIGEANIIAEQYQLQGFDARIVKKSQAGMSIYEVWIAKDDQRM